MILKRQHSTEFLIGKLCLFSLDSIVINSYEYSEITYIVYVASGNVVIESILENTSVSYNFKQNDLIDLRTLSDNFSLSYFKINASNQGAVCILFSSPFQNLETSYQCQVLKNWQDIDTAKNSTSQVLISLIDHRDLELHIGKILINFSKNKLQHTSLINYQKPIGLLFYK